MNLALIDDDNTTNFIHRVKLTNSFPDANIHIFNNGKEIYDFLINNDIKFDFALLDLNMPVMNGVEFLNLHKTLKEEKKINKIILFIEQSIDHTFIKDFDIYLNLTKPLTDKKIALIFHDK